MEMHLIYYQADTVSDSINNFIVNLLEALAIVLAILLIFMGLRSGLLIGAMLLLTILATFVAMKITAIDLHSISLGALIIALGMLVDNAIVIADGILVGVQQGKDAETSAREVVEQTQMPLLGATIIAVIAFAPIGLSRTARVNSARAFQVGNFLMLSWVLAVTVTPAGRRRDSEGPRIRRRKRPYDTLIYRTYRGFLRLCLTHRKTVILAVLPYWHFHWQRSARWINHSSPTPRAHVHRGFLEGQGSGVEATLADGEKMQQFLAAQPETKSVAVYAGEGALRFILTYTPGDPLQTTVILSWRPMIQKEPRH